MPKQSKPIFKNKNDIILKKDRSDEYWKFEILTPWLGNPKDNSMMFNLFLNEKQARKLMDLLIKEFWKPSEKVKAVIEKAL